MRHSRSSHRPLLCNVRTADERSSLLSGTFDPLSADAALIREPSWRRLRPCERGSPPVRWFGPAPRWRAATPIAGDILLEIS